MANLLHLPGGETLPGVTGGGIAVRAVANGGDISKAVAETKNLVSKADIIRNNQAVGKRAEGSVSKELGLQKNNSVRTESSTGKYRVPDFIKKDNKNVISYLAEVKNVKMLRVTNQLKDSGIKSVSDYMKDPRYRNILSEEDIEELKFREKNQKEGRKMLYEVQQKLGLSHEIHDLHDLTIEQFKKAVPIVIEWLEKEENYRNKEGLIRLLSVPYAKEKAQRFFINEFINVSDEKEHDYKWAIGNGLEIFAADDICDDLVSIVLDKRHGTARQMVVLGLGKMKLPENKEKATDALIKLLMDEDVAGHAIESLGKLKAKRSRPYIEQFLTHKKAWWRNAAKSAIKKFINDSN